VSARENLSASILGAGLDRLHVVSARIDEALSEVARASAVLVGEVDVDDAAIVGAPVALVVSRDGASARFFHGIVEAFAFEGALRAGRRRYRVDLAHELVRLEHRADMRLFLEEDARSVVAAVLEGAGLPATRIAWSVARALPKRRQTTQRRETDLAFVRRLLAHEGVAFVAEHGEEGATLRLFDHPAAITPIAGGDALVLRADRAHGPGVHRFEVETIALPGRVTLGDVDEEHPDVDLFASADVGAGGRFERFDYPGGQATPEEGRVLARLRAEEIAARRLVARGASDRLELRPAASFALAGATRAALDRRWQLTRVAHRFELRPEDGEAAAAFRPTYANTFEAIPEATPFRPPLPPRVPARGVDAAIVGAPRGQEIHVDALGRLVARFAWDHGEAPDGASSRALRLVQVPIGGSMTLARAGWEVAVAYAHGDPDRPIAIGRRYDATTPAPYAYPGAAARSSFQSASTPGGAAVNELRASDDAGSEELFLHASKDLATTVGANQRATIGANDSRTVGATSSTAIGGARTEAIGGSLATTVGADESTHVGASRTSSVGGAESVTVSGNVTEIVAGADSEVVGGSAITTGALGVTRTVTGSASLAIAGSRVSATAGSASVAVAGARSETIGGSSIAIAGSSIASSSIGAMALTIGGVQVQAAGGNATGGAKGPSVFTVGGVTVANAAGTLSIKSKRVAITAGALANLVGGGATLTLTAGSASFVGVVGVDASGGLKLVGNPNLLG
jgi:type VI secretion system secreted protein VgrG